MPLYTVWGVVHIAILSVPDSPTNHLALKNWRLPRRRVGQPNQSGGLDGAGWVSEPYFASEPRKDHEWQWVHQLESKVRSSGRIGQPAYPKTPCLAFYTLIQFRWQYTSR